MTAVGLNIVLFVVVGVAFGLATYSRRHFFSEGGTRPQPRRSALDGIVMWCAICSGLWPIFAATGLWNAARLATKGMRGKAPR